MRPLIHRADVVVTINNEDTSFFKRFSKRVVRVPHWNYNCPEFHNNIRVIPRLLFVGRWEEAKGVEYVEMASTLCSSITCIVPYKVKRLNKSITFKSNLSRHELDEEYERSGIIIIPSKYEAFSFVALEALQMEKIVLMSNKVRILDYLDGLPNVIIFEYGNPEDFLLKLKNILRVREVQVDPEHYSKTMEQFTPLRAYTSYLNIFRSIAS
jgi:glycosyltransferase involved in cell wall biosynthesis